MSLKRRLIISNASMMFIPIIITVAAGIVFSYVSYYLGNGNLQFSNFKAITKIERELMLTGETIWKESPETLAKTEFQKYLTAKLSGINADVLVLKDREAVYSTKDYSNIDIEKILDIESGTSLQKKIRIGTTTYLFNSYQFLYPGDIEGAILVFAPVSKEADNAGVFLIFIAAVYLVSFFITNILYSVKLSKSLATPLSKLKVALGEISSGNLNYAIIEEGDEEIREVSRALDQMRLKLEESIVTQMKYDDNRKMLVSSISHDLKTPITSIKGYVEGILDKVADTPEKRVKYLKTIYQKAVQIDSMIDDLLLYSKLDLKQIPFNFEKTDIAKYFQDCIEEVEADMERNGILISFTKTISDEIYVSIDRAQIKRVVLNLLENAAKYKSPDREGIIKITLRQAADFVIIEVKDNGIGIPKVNLPFIFDRFYRADTARTKAEGSGLGLAIARQIVEGHGGKIWARSIENEGTEFMVSIKKEKG